MCRVKCSDGDFHLEQTQHGIVLKAFKAIKYIFIKSMYNDFFIIVLLFDFHLLKHFHFIFFILLREC